MADSVAPIGVATYAIGALTFLVLLGLLVRRTRGLNGALVMIAVAATAAWATAMVLDEWGAWDRPKLVAGLELLRSLSWIAVLVGLLYSGVSERRRILGRKYLGPVLALALATVLGLAVLPDSLVLGEAQTLEPIEGLILAVLALFLTEIMYRNTPPDERWQIKFLCIALGVMFAYDLFLYADAGLFGSVDDVLQQARGAVQAVSAPLFAVAAARNEVWRTNIALSRQVVLGSTTLIASGLYLLLAAAAGLVLREIDEARGPVVQVIFFVGALAVLAVVLSSGAYWAYARGFINRHFYRQKYDWREEWVRYMQTISTGQSAAPLEERCVKAIADIVESTGGAMWLLDGDRCEHACSWNFDVPDLSEEVASAFARVLPSAPAVIDLPEAMAGSEVHGAIAIPEALKTSKRAWLVVPLRHRSLIGFVVLAEPRAPRSLDWEDYDLLNVVGRQAASYLAEQKAQEKLEQAREFEIFNRHYAFVVHDVKNLVSQLSVLGKNFERFGHRKKFRDDVVSTLNDASEKMTRLMERIHAFEANLTLREPHSLEPLIRRVVAANGSSAARLVFEGRGADLAVRGDRDRLEAVFGHLLRNAFEAVNGRGTVKIDVRRNRRFAIVDVTDDGPGMDREFIRRELFKPFQTTKREGMGIGVYQCREYTREMGGNLEAISTPGEGTTMRVTLPIADER